MQHLMQYGILTEINQLKQVKLFHVSQKSQHISSKTFLFLPSILVHPFRFILDECLLNIKWATDTDFKDSTVKKTTTKKTGDVSFLGRNQAIAQWNPHIHTLLCVETKTSLCILSLLHFSLSPMFTHTQQSIGNSQAIRRHYLWSSTSVHMSW